MIDVLSKRSEPGICVFDLHQHICFLNHTAKEFWGENLLVIPPEIEKIYNHTKECLEEISCETQRNENLTKLVDRFGSSYLIRSITLPCHKKRDGHVLVLIEKMRTDGINLPHIQETFHLTARECDVVRCLFSGLTNKEIASSLEIEVNTVKDYLKNIMHKMEVTTRTGILSKTILSTH